ncbi:cytochrome P450 [Scleroderma yunnanense]
MRRRGLHSLPGPRRLPLIGNLLDINASEPWLTYTEWGKRYGGIVHSTLLGTDLIIINDEEIVHELIEKRSTIYSGRPSLSLTGFLGLDFTTGITPYGDRWRLHRKMFNIAFNKQAAMAYRPMQMRKVRQMLQGVITAPQDYSKHTRTFSGSIIMAITYGYDAMPEDDPFVSQAMRFAELVLTVVTIERAVVFSAFPILAYTPSWVPGGRYKQWAEEIRALARKGMDEPFSYVKQNMIAGLAKKSLVNDLVVADIGRGTDHEDVIKEVAASAFLGHLQTHATILMFILAMTLYPEAQTKAQEEIDRVVGRDRLPDFSDRENLPYVESVLLETLRWHPISPLGFAHLTTSDDVYNGMYIPKGNFFILTLNATRAMTQDETRYPNPTAFIPERHLNEDGKITGDFLVPIFGSGRRICAGRHVADQSIWAVMVSMLATLHIRKAKDKLGNEIDVKPEFMTGIVLHPKPFACSIVPRSSKAEQLIRSSNMLDE